MSGIALIIPGADFSNSPLGRVTFSKTLEERVNDAVAAYATASGVNTHKDELKTLIRGLMTCGAWDNIEVYPMLGNTRAAVRTPLNPDAIVWFGSITFTTNTVVNQDYISLSAADTSALCPEGEQKVEHMDSGKKNEIVGSYLFAHFKKTNNLPPTSTILGSNFSIISKNNSTLQQSALGFGSLRGYQEDCAVRILNTRVSASTVLTDTGFTAYADGDVVITHEQNLNEGSLVKINSIGLSNNVGGDASFYTNSDVYMVAIGKLETIQVETVNELLDDFVRATKPIS